MEDQNVLIYLDKIKKLLELGNKDKAITEIDTLEMTLSRAIAKKKGHLILPILIPQPTETEKSNPILLREFELANKFNEIIHFINGRFQH